MVIGARICWMVKLNMNAVAISDDIDEATWSLVKKTSHSIEIAIEQYL